MTWGEENGTILDLDYSRDGGDKRNFSSSTLFSPALIKIRSSPFPTPLLTSNTSMTIPRSNEA